MSIYEERDWVTDLATAWEDAERGAGRRGDIAIERLDNGVTPVSYRVAEVDEDWNELAYVRILKRAPKPEPKPRVVMASWTGIPGHREAYTLQPDGEWESIKYAVETDDLVDPVEMVEVPDRQALTDAMLGVFYRAGGYDWPGTIPLVDAVLELLKEEA